MLDKHETFTALFTRLKAEVKDSPAVLSWYPEENEEFKRLVCEVGKCAHTIEREQAEKPERHTTVPPGFVTAWKEYNRRYKRETEKIVEAQEEKEFKALHNAIEEIAEQKNSDFETTLLELASGLGVKKNPGSSFNPLDDNPAELLERALLFLHDCQDSRILPDDEMDKYIGAWYFFENTIGWDFKEIYERWKQTPELFIPRHARRVNTRPIEELYGEAVNAWVFGNKVASVAMCRVLLEHILRKHYGIKEEDLDKMVTTAEKRSARFRRLGLHEKRKFVNRLLHRYERTSNIEDKAVVEFLSTIKELVIDIPK